MTEGQCQCVRLDSPEQKLKSSHRRAAINVITTAYPAIVIAFAIADDDVCEFMPVSTNGNEDRFHRLSLADILGDRNR